PGTKFAFTVSELLVFIPATNTEFCPSPLSNARNTQYFPILSSCDGVAPIVCLDPGRKSNWPEHSGTNPTGAFGGMRVVSGWHELSVEVTVLTSVPSTMICNPGGFVRKLTRLATENIAMILTGRVTTTWLVKSGGLLPIDHP